MKKALLAIILILVLSTSAFCGFYSYSFPKTPKNWGDPVSFNNLSPGFFQVMFRDFEGTVRIATYGIAGGSMDTLKDPQLMMVFVFDKEGKRISSNISNE
ncbi:hypothetical protein ACFLZ2_03865 [Candidatus Margulisiibacteriota bacterium]